MSRHPIGERAMTTSERQRRYLAKLVASAKPAPRADGDLMINLEHLRRWPDRIVPWLCQRLGRQTAVAVHEVMGRTLKTMPKEDNADADFTADDMSMTVPR